MNLDLEQIKAAARAATGGEWVVDRRSHEDRRIYVAQDYKGEPGGRICEVFENCLVREPQRTANAELIAAMHPAVVLALIERLERAEAAAAQAHVIERRRAGLEQRARQLTAQLDQASALKNAAQDELAALRGDMKPIVALGIALRYGGIDGAHHKSWVIDQMCRALLGNEYDAWVAEAKDGEDGPESYDWDVGIAP